MNSFLEVTLGGLLGSGSATAMMAAFLLRRNKTLELSIKSRFDEAIKVFESTRTWKQQILFELLGPMVMQLDRTNRAFKRWNAENLYLEANVVREGNLVLRDLLLAKGHLIPPELMPHASALVEHYDAWLEEFDRVRKNATPPEGAATRFVFVGPKGYGFPHEAEAQFRAEFRKLQQELYGV